MVRRRRAPAPMPYGAMSVAELRAAFLKNTSEDAVQVEIIGLLRQLPPPPLGPYWNAVNPIPIKSKVAAGQSKRLGLRSGAPDIDILWSGRFAGIEVKRPVGGTVQNSQSDIHDEIIAAGGFVAVVRSLGEFVAFMRETFPAELAAVRSRLPVVIPWWDIAHA